MIETRRIWWLTAVAVVLFVPLFILQHTLVIDFWWWMAIDLTILLSLTAWIDRGWVKAIQEDLKRPWIKKTAIAMGSAVVLYGIFALGNLLSRQVISFASGQIQAVYDFRGDTSTMRIGLSILFVIGPGEELFWRGFLQRRLGDRLGTIKGWLFATAIYALVHIGSMNLMLVLAAGVCGLFWGFMFLKTRSVLVCVISHTLWDLMVFLWFPLH